MRKKNQVFGKQLIKDACQLIWLIMEEATQFVAPPLSINQQQDLSLFARESANLLWRQAMGPTRERLL
ncbi:MAG: hypothetical protein IMW89_20380 [Ktedonobacteraceae bacterium]|nr:hypothetical protein [Ktedonobacteraceae bacterium]